MSETFSTRCVRVIPCPDPVLTIGFPTRCCPGPNTVVLANGACVDVVQLGQIISQFCPDAAATTALSQAELTPDIQQQLQVQLQTIGVDANQMFAVAQQAGADVQAVGQLSVAIPTAGSQVFFTGSTSGGCGCRR